MATLLEACLVPANGLAIGCVRKPRGERTFDGLVDENARGASNYFVRSPSKNLTTPCRAFAALRRAAHHPVDDGVILKFATVRRAGKLFIRTDAKPEKSRQSRENIFYQPCWRRMYLHNENNAAHPMPRITGLICVRTDGPAGKMIKNI